MPYIVKLYVIEGEMDGEEFAVGPFDQETMAEIEAEQLRARGDVVVLPLYEDADAALAEIP